MSSKIIRSNLLFPKWRRSYWITLMVLASFVFGVLYEPIQKTWISWSLPLSGKIIVIDAGHGGPDGGAVSQSGTIEKEITLKISTYLENFLTESGAYVIMTRDGDYDLAEPNTKKISRRKAEDLSNRVRIVRESGADLLISIHLNSIPSDRWSGAQTFYNPNRDENKRLASLIQYEITRTLENTNRIAKAKNDVYLLKHSPITTALVEVGFLSHHGEAKKLATEEYQKQMAGAIYYGITSFMEGKEVSSSNVP